MRTLKKQIEGLGVVSSFSSGPLVEEAEDCNEQVCTRLSRYANYGAPKGDDPTAIAVFSTILEKRRAANTDYNKYSETIRLLGLEAEKSAQGSETGAPETTGGGSQFVNELMTRVPFGTFAALHYNYARPSGGALSVSGSETGAASALASWNDAALSEVEAFKAIAGTHVLARKSYQASGSGAEGEPGQDRTVVKLDSALRTIYQREAYLNEMVANLATTYAHGGQADLGESHGSAHIANEPGTSGAPKSADIMPLFPQHQIDAKHTEDGPPQRVTAPHPDTRRDTGPERKRRQRRHKTTVKAGTVAQQGDGGQKSAGLSGLVLSPTTAIEISRHDSRYEMSHIYDVPTIWRDEGAEEEHFTQLMDRLACIRSRLG